MTNITDNPPPLPEPDLLRYGQVWFSPEKYRAGEAAAFSRGVAAGQAAMQEKLDLCQSLFEASIKDAKRNFDEANELRAKLKALEEQEPVSHVKYFERSGRPKLAWHSTGYLKEGDFLYTAAGAKESRKCGDECKRICQHPDPFGGCAK